MIVIENLSVGYHKKALLKPLNATCEEGTVISLIGVNGSGKSTLLKTILGLIPPIKGKLFIEGSAIFESTFKEKSKLISAVLTQVETSDLTVQEFVQLGRMPYVKWYAKYSQKDDLEVQKIIDLLGLRALKNQSIQTLSDGQFQKTHIARAFVQDTPFIVLDEPTSHLDLANKFEVFSVLHKLAQITKKTILLSSHEIQLALQFSNQIWYIREQDIFKGPPEEIAYNHKLYDEFSNNLITFNYQESRFILTKNTFRKIDVSGEGVLYYWVKHLLLRKGYSLHKETVLKIDVQKKIIIKNGQETHVLNDLKELESWCDFVR